jgi:hypothetical protein
MITTIYAKTYQHQVQPRTWTLIGVNGYHKNNTSVATTSTLDECVAAPSTCITIKDTNDTDDNTTYEHNLTEYLSVSYPNQGLEKNSTIGLKLLRLNGISISSVTLHYQKREKNTTKAMLAMFVSSFHDRSIPNVKIEFQEDYEGKPFLMTFDSGANYKGVFSSTHSHDKPAILTTNSSATYRKVEDIFDANTDDNNISHLDFLNPFDQANQATGLDGKQTTGGRQSLGDNNLTMYRWNSTLQQWQFFVYKAGSLLISDFTKVTAGQAYWTYFDAGEDTNGAFLLGQNEINASGYYAATGTLEESPNDAMAQRQWNLLSFNESEIIKSSTGIFVNHAAYETVGFKIRRGINIHEEITIPANLCNSEINISAYINNTALVNERNGSNDWNVRAYPADFPDKGIFIVSNDMIDVNISTVNVQSASGATLTDSQLNDYNSTIKLYKTSPLDEHILACRVNEELMFNTPSADRKGRIVGIMLSEQYDVNISRMSDMNDSASLLTSALQNKDGDGTSQVYSIDTNFDGNTDTLLMASSENFTVQDSTFVRVYEYDGSAGAYTTRIHGSNGFSSFTSDNSIDTTVTNINAIANVTRVVAYKVNKSKNRIITVSDNKIDARIIEDNTISQFTAVDFDKNESTLGAISKVYSGFDLATAVLREFNSTAVGAWDILESQIVSGDQNTGVPYIINAMTDDLRYSPISVREYPLSTPLYDFAETSTLDVEQLISGYSYGPDIFWRYTEITFDPSTWREKADALTLFRVGERNGHWLYLNTKTSTNPITYSSDLFTGSMVQTFDNNFTYRSNEIGKVHNSIDKTFMVNIAGLTDATTLTDGSSSTVEAKIAGKKYHMTKVGSTTYSLDLNGFQLEGLNDREFPSLEMGIEITAVDGYSSRKKSIYHLDNVKPIAPTYYYINDFNSSSFMLDMNSTDLKYVKIFDGNISDLTVEQGNIMVTSDSLDTNKTYKINPARFSSITFGTSTNPINDLRVIGVDDNGSFSDMRRVLYAPVYKGSHILENNDTETTIYDTSPIAYNSTGEGFAQYVDGNGAAIDAGVQFLVNDGNSNDGNTSYMSYNPHTSASLSGGVPNVVTINTENGDEIGTIGYTTVYEGDVFYVYRQDDNLSTQSIYYGVFPTASGALNLTAIDSNQTFIKPSI